MRCSIGGKANHFTLSFSAEQANQPWSENCGTRLPHSFSGTNFTSLMRRLLCVTISGCLCFSSVQAADNNWTNRVSGKWESPFWSLGKLPASDQAVRILNDGYKAVSIDSATVSGFPSSVTVGSLEVGAPTNAVSTLLLNYFGLNAPFKVLGFCVLWTNGTVLNLASSFEVDGANDGAFVLYGGTFTQEGGLTVVPSVQLQNGMINATNATMNLGPLYIGTSGNFYQSDGTILTDGLQIDSGTYTLAAGGTLYVLDKTILTDVAAHFNQVSGTNFGDVRMSGGYYHFYNGWMRGNDLFFTGYGNFFQHGGTAEFGTMEIYGGQGGPNYTLETGTLRCGELDITGLFRQYGGTLSLTNGLYMHGGIFDLVGGTVLMPSMVISNLGVFNHYFGTNQVSGDVALYNTSLQFEGGRFSSANLGVGQGAALGQESGSNEVSGVLSITGNYYLSGGVLSVSGVYLRGTLSIVSSGVNPPPGFLNHGLINFGGTLNISASQDSMGQLGLSTNGTINLGASSLVVRFADSSSLNWDSNSRLMISGWNGSYSGNGSNQIYFGNSSVGLTPNQLSQLRFVNPAGSPPGYYDAQILSNGEVVPAAASLQLLRLDNQLVLIWTGNAQLLSATNLFGPYEPVSEAASPYTNDMRAAPYQFFRLQGQ